jgi:hypothetical protein
VINFFDFFLFLKAICQTPFGPPYIYSTGLHPKSVTAGDFNRDTKLDIVVTNAGDGSISVLFGNGDGIFQNQTTYSTGHNPESMTVGDFNNDTILDIAVANTDDNTISVLLGNGDGTFQTKRSTKLAQAQTL